MENNNLNFLESKTYSNLQKSFQIESKQAHIYLYYAKIAELEGNTEMAAIFNAFAEGGVCTAHGNLDFLRNLHNSTKLKVGGTDENIRFSSETEGVKYINFYEQAANEAYNEGLYDIASWFINMSRFKKAHADQLYATLNNKNK